MTAAGPTITEDGGAIRFDVQVSPRASRDRIGPVHGDRIKVQLTAPPVDDAANEAIRALFARALGVPRAEVTIVRGHTSKRKTLRVGGASPAALLALITPEAPSP